MTDNNSTRWMPTAGGVLNIISGGFGIIGSLFLVFFATFFRDFMRDYYWDFSYYGDIPAAFFWFTGILLAVLSIFALIGGIFAVQRKSWGLALTGSICAILQGINILGIISTIFIAMSKKEFTS